MQTQTGARWIEIPVLFSQATSSSTVVTSSQSTANVASFTAGVRAAHKKNGFHVFAVPLMGVQESGGWSGSIQFKTYAQEQAWFDSYWQMLQPYAVAAANNGVEQMAVATECQWLQQYAPASLWNQLVTRVRGVFKNTLTYDMNWSSLTQPVASWLRNPELAMVGVSSYIPLSDTPTRIDPSQMITLWRDKIKNQLDSFALQLGKWLPGAPFLRCGPGFRSQSATGRRAYRR